MDPSLTRESLARLLEVEASVLADLERLLAREHEILVRNDSPEAMATLQPTG